MSEPADFALIRGGNTRFYRDRWAGVFLHREIAWGPDAFESWVTQLTETDGWLGGCIAGAVVDLDQKRLVWLAESDSLHIPKVRQIYDRLLAEAWPGFQIQAAASLRDLAQAVGASDLIEPGQDEDLDEDDDRPDSVDEAARSYEDEDEDADEEWEGEDYEPFLEDELRAWLCVIGNNKTIQHRQLEKIPLAVIENRDSCLEQIADLPPAEVPPEEYVLEGMWIDEANRRIGVWGGNDFKQHVSQLEGRWHGWSVAWAERGYEQQCEFSGPAGIPLDDTAALAKLLPTILSTSRLDMQTMLGVLGGSLKKTAMKATGCLLFVVCLPLLILGAATGSWQPVLVTIGITCGVVVALFKIVEYRFKRSFQREMPEGEEGPAAAGPQDAGERRKYLDAILVAAGLPRISASEHQFSEKDEFELLD